MSILLTFLLIKKTPKSKSFYKRGVEWGYPNSTGYLNPVGYGFEVLVFILVEN
jgi:hypothetical protein